MNSDHPLNSFKIKADFKASTEKVFNCWTSSDSIIKWFLRKADFISADGKKRNTNEEIQKGDSYSWLWFGFSDDACQEGKILENNHNDFLKFTFTDDCIVSVKVYSINNETILELLQENIPDVKDLKKSLYIQCQIGWTFYLANMKSILEEGIDLRNKKMEVDSVFK